MSTWLRELRYAARVLWRNRIATLVAFVSLALAIGATTAIFTVVDATLLRALPFRDADRLVQLARGVFVLAPARLFAMATVAALRPAPRAASVDPSTALRAD